MQRTELVEGFDEELLTCEKVVPPPVPTSPELAARAFSFPGWVLPVTILLISTSPDPSLSDDGVSSACTLFEVVKPLLFSPPRPDVLFGQAVDLA